MARGGLAGRFKTAGEGQRRGREPFKRDVLLRAAVIVALGAGWLVAPAVPSALASGTCRNEATRSQQRSTYLPECRAYELITPLDAHPNLENGTVPYVGSGRGGVEAQAASSPGAIAYRSWYSPAETPTMGEYFLSRREGGRWTTSDITPPSDPDTRIACFLNLYPTESLDTEVLPTDPPGCDTEAPPLVAGEPRNVANLFVATTEPLGPFQLVNLTPASAPPSAARFQAESADGSRVIFDEAAPLVSGAPGGDDLYIWSEGIVRLVTYDSAGNAEGGVMASGAYSTQPGFGSSPAGVTHAVSSDGESVFFESGGNLYLREHAAQPQSVVEGGVCKQPELACTVEVDNAVLGATGSSGGGTFQWASSEGTKVFFTDESRLTSGSTAEAHRPDLYEYEVATRQLNDLTAHAGGAADVQGVAGAAANGSYVYFVADGVLTSTANSRGQLPHVNKPNLYVASSGKDAFIATLSEADSHDWGANAPDKPIRVVSGLTSVVTTEGTTIAFNSVQQLTEYENAPESPTQCYGAGSEDRAGAPCNEIFEYSVASGQLSCVSCGQPGSQPTGMAELRAAAGVTQRRPLMGNGRIFFDTPSTLVSSAETSHEAPAVSNVYEWAPAGASECTETSSAYNQAAGGCQYLISGGRSKESSYFVDASENGEDVYLLTTEALATKDTDNGPSLYDAHIEGEPAEPQTVTECAGEQCRGSAPTAPSLGSPETAIFTGPAAVSEGKPKVTRQQLLRRALKACERKPRNKRRACRERAQHRYGKSSAKKRKKTKRSAAHSKRGGRQ